MRKNLKITAGRELANYLFDFRVIDLIRLDSSDKKKMMREFEGLEMSEVEDVIHQVIHAKSVQQSRITWQLIPRDLAVIITCLFASLYSIKIGIVAGIAVQVLLEGVFQILYSYEFSKILGKAIWLAYFALILQAYTMHKQGQIWWIIALTLLAIWFGSYIFGFLIRIPLALFVSGKPVKEGLSKVD